VPKPGVRLNLADLVGNLPSGQNLSYIFDINNHGDMLGLDDQGGSFLLERTGAKGSAFSTAAYTAHTSSPGVENGRRAVPAVAAAMLHRHMLSPHALNPDSTLPQNLLERLQLK